MSRTSKCLSSAPDTEVVAEIARVLTEGGAVVMPTETQYGLAVRADRANALTRICEIKKRDANLRPALFVKDLKMAETFCHISSAARLLAEQFLPGPITLVLPAISGQRVISADFISEQGVGIRISSSPLVKAVMDAVAFPITATSANQSGKITPATVDEIKKDLGDTVDLYVDGGPSRGIVPSTVVKVNDDMEILRHGAIPEREIAAALQKGMR
ncbi:MAG: L-threonylcarbamoyladenylate synthase [Candidatus Zixiibacteriota bacterium]